MDAFDADVLIYAAVPGHYLGGRVAALFEAAPDPAEVVGVGSVLLVPELLVERGNDDRQDEHQVLDLLLERLDLIEVSPHLARLATAYRSRYGLKTVDAVHLATAVEAGADRFITNNSKDFPTTITEIDITYPTDLPDPAS